jgi:hypothetical protein
MRRRERMRAACFDESLLNSRRCFALPGLELLTRLSAFSPPMTALRREGKGCYLPGDAVVGVASVLLPPKAAVADVELLVVLVCWLEFADTARGPLSELVTPGVP